MYTVSALNDEVRELLEAQFPRVWVEGEVSNLAKPRSGHIYFTLKDERAQVRCAMFRSQNRLLDFDIANGVQVLMRARMSLYRERGDYQLIADYLELAGAGALRRRFELLRQRLASEGLFDTAHKRPLPALCRRVGIVTSPTGAALRDVLKTLNARFPALEVVIYPTRVQGEGAAAEIAQAIASADARAECDALILARGGGSLEDLWAFNEEVTARAIAACQLPLVCGVGHETDVTIADFVADVRAPTPTGAAQLIAPDGAALRDHISALQVRLAQRTGQHLMLSQRDLERAGRRLRHPRQVLERWAQRCDDQLLRLAAAARTRLAAAQADTARAETRLERVGPMALIRAYQGRCRLAANGLRASWAQRASGASAALRELGRALSAVSPQRTLERGYAVVTDAESGEILRRADQAKAGQTLRARLAHGRLRATVQDVEPGHRDHDDIDLGDS